MNAPLSLITVQRARGLLETARMRKELGRPVEIQPHELEALCMHFLAAGGLELRTSERASVLDIVRRHIHSSHFLRVQAAVESDAKTRGAAA